MGLSVNAEIAASVASFRFNEVELRRLQAIPVMADLSRRAIRVESAAKRNASGRPGPNVRTGRLRGSITWRPGVDARSAYVDIGTAVVYAPFVELGTSRSPAYPFLRPALEAARTI
jgi:phage gpG-like protein